MSKHTAHETSSDKERKQKQETQSATDTAKTAEAVDTAQTEGAKQRQDAQKKAADEQAMVPESELIKVQEELGAKNAALEAELSNLKDQYLRKAAEFENFRKRMSKEKQDAIDFANQNLLLDLIPVIDDFERAIKSSEASRDYTSLHEGISLIEKRLVTQLENKWGLVRFDSAGQEFDPNKHEAIMMEKSPDVEEPTVAEDFLKGYTLKERVVRSAKVKVLMPGEAPAAESDEASRAKGPKEAENN